MLQILSGDLFIGGWQLVSITDDARISIQSRTGVITA
jgi:hypothetical protein